MALDPRRPTICAGCGSEFARDPKMPSRIYCTWECFKRSRHVAETCVVCGAGFESYLSEHRKRLSRGHVACCSRSCRNSYTSSLLGGDGTWVVGGRYARGRRGWDWRKVRAAYLATVGGVCEGCGSAKAAEVHHLFPVGRGGDPSSFDNLMATCRECHRNMHEQISSGAFDCCFAAVREEEDHA